MATRLYVVAGIPPGNRGERHLEVRAASVASAKRKAARGWRIPATAVRLVRTNPPELRKVHAGLESAYLAAIARKDPTSRKLAKRIKGPWMVVEKLLKRGAVPRGNPRRSSSGKVAYSVKRGGRRVGHIVASSKAAAVAEAHRAGLTLGARLKHVRSNPPHGATLSTRAESITYKHQDDGEWYRHRFSPGVVVRVAPDRKSVRLYRPDGKPLAGNFDV